MDIKEVKSIEDLKGKCLNDFYDWEHSGFWDSDYNDENYYVLEEPDSGTWEDEYSNENYVDDIYNYIDGDDVEENVATVREVLKNAMTCEPLPFCLPDNVIDIMLDEAERIVRSPEFKENGFGDVESIQNAGLLIAYECFVCLEHNDEIFQKIWDDVIEEINTPDYDPPEPREMEWYEPWA